MAQHQTIPTTPDPSGCPGTVRHGDYRAYRRGCRCPAARVDWMRHKHLVALGRAPDLLISPIGTIRRLEGLALLGWPAREIADRLGITVQAIGHLRSARKYVRVDTAARVDAVFRELCWTRGPKPCAATYARKRGAVPWLAWDDIDDPDETPQHEARGTVRSIAKHDEQIAWLTAHGRSATEIAVELGIAARTVNRARARLAAAADEAA